MIARFSCFAKDALMMPLRDRSSLINDSGMVAGATSKMQRLNYGHIGVLLMAASVLAGCTTASTGGGGPRGLLSPRPSPSASYISALQGGIIGRTGATLSESDRSRALEAEYRALEDAAPGRATPWKGRNADGEVVANAPYQVGTQNCRQYRHTVTVGGKEVVARGAACRNTDGTWSPLI